MLTADGEAGDTLLRIFSQNTMPLYRLGLFSHNLWDTRAKNERNNIFFPVHRIGNTVYCRTWDVATAMCLRESER